MSKKRLNSISTDLASFFDKLPFRCLQISLIIALLQFPKKRRVLAAHRLAVELAGRGAQLGRAGDDDLVSVEKLL